MNKELFKYFQALNRDTGKSTAKALNITQTTLSSRLNGSRGDLQGQKLLFEAALAFNR